VAPHSRRICYLSVKYISKRFLSYYAL